jgi:hypothetical protein
VSLRPIQMRPLGPENPEAPPEEEFGIGSALAGAGIGAGVGAVAGGGLPGAVVGGAIGFFGGLGWLDFLGRPARTMLHTGDPEQAWKSVWDKKEASTEDDLLRTYMGWEPMDKGEGFDLGDVADFVARVGVGALTDPLTYVNPAAITRKAALTRTLGYKTVSRYQTELRAIDVEAKLGKIPKREADQVKGLMSNRMAREHNAEAALYEQRAGLDAGSITRVDEPYKFNSGMKWEQAADGDFGPSMKAYEAQQLKRYAATGEGIESERKAAEMMTGLGISMELPESHDLMNQLSNFGLGKTFAERVARGEQWAVGIGRPWGEEKAHGVVLQPLVDFLSAKGEVAESFARATPLGRYVLKSTSDLRQYIFNPVRRDALEQIMASARNAPYVELAKMEPALRAWQSDMSKAKMSDDEFSAFIQLAGYRNKDSEKVMADVIKGAKEVIGKGGVERAAKIDALIDRFGKLEADALVWQQNAGVPVVGLKEDLRKSVSFFLEEKKQLRVDGLSKKRDIFEARRMRQDLLNKIDAVAEHQDQVIQNVRGVTTYADEMKAYTHNGVARDARKLKLDAIADEGARNFGGKAVSHDAAAWMKETGGSIEAYYAGPASPFARYTTDDINDLSALAGTTRTKKGAAAQPSATGPAEAGVGIPPAAAAPGYDVPVAPQLRDVRIRLIDNLNEANRAQVRAALKEGGVDLRLLDEVVDAKDVAEQAGSAAHAANFAKARMIVDDLAGRTDNPLGNYIETMRSSQGAQLPMLKKPDMKLTSLEKKYDVQMPWNMTSDEWWTHVSKPGLFVDVDAASREHLRQIAKAVFEDHIVVPMRVIDSYEGFPIKITTQTKLGPKVLSVEELRTQNMNNNTRYATGVILPAQDIAELKRLEKEILDKTQERAEIAASRKMIMASLKQTEDLLARTPEHIHCLFTEEALESSIQRAPGRPMAIGRVASAVRKYIKEGHALTPVDVNDLIKDDRKSGRLLALGGKRPDGFVPLSDLLTCMSPEVSDDVAIGWASKILPKSADASVIEAKAKELQKMSHKDRIKAVSGAYGKLFDERPEVALAATIDEAAKSISKQQMYDDVRNLFCRKQRGVDVAEGTAERNAQRKSQIEDLKANRGKGERRRQVNKQIKRLEAELEQERKLVLSAPTEDGARWVPAEELDPKFKGYEMKEEVYNRMLAHREMMNKPQTYSAITKAMSWHTKLFKAAALGWPGSWFRDSIGNSLLRVQNQCYHAKSFLPEEQMKLAQLAWSNGTSANLDKIEFKFPGIGGVGPERKLGGKDFFDEALRSGMIDADQVNAELMTKLRQKQTITGSVLKKYFKPRNVLQSLDRLQAFHARLMHGDDFAEAAAKVNAALYDYRSVSPFVEMTRTSGVIPFGTWLAKNIPAQMELFVKHPGQFAGMLHVKNAVERGVPGVSDKDLPEYVKDKFNIVLGKRDGKVVFFTADNVVPMADLPALGTQSIGDWMSNALGPIPKGMFEQLANHELYNWRQIQSYDGQLSPLNIGKEGIIVPARVAHGLKVMVGRPLTIAEQFSDYAREADLPPEKQKGFFGRSALVNAFTGIGVKTTDPRENMMREIKRQRAEVQKAMQDASYYRKRGQIKAAQAAQERAATLAERMRD